MTQKTVVAVALALAVLGTPEAWAQRRGGRGSTNKVVRSTGRGPVSPRNLGNRPTIGRNTNVFTTTRVNGGRYGGFGTRSTVAVRTRNPGFSGRSIAGAAAYGGRGYGSRNYRYGRGTNRALALTTGLLVGAALGSSFRRGRYGGGYYQGRYYAPGVYPMGYFAGGYLGGSYYAPGYYPDSSVYVDSVAVTGDPGAAAAAADPGYAPLSEAEWPVAQQWLNYRAANPAKYQGLAAADPRVADLVARADFEMSQGQQ
jgi:hypothetical protein